MKLERKTALRFLKMGIAMYESGNLEENILNVVDQYIPEQYQVPKKYRKRYGKKKGKKKFRATAAAATGCNNNDGQRFTKDKRKDKRKYRKTIWT